VFRHVTEMRARLERLLENVEAGNRSPPRSGRHEAGKNPHRGGFARAVRPEKPHDLSFADLEIQIVDCRLSGKALGEMFDPYHFESESFSDNRSASSVAKFFVKNFSALRARSYPHGDRARCDRLFRS